MRPVKQEKPPRQNRGGLQNPFLSALTLQRIPAYPVFGLCGDEFQSHLSAQNTRDKSSDRVSLPAGGFHQVRSRGSAGSLQQVKKLRGLGAAPAASGVFYRLSRLRPPFGVLRLGGLFARLALRRRHVARTCTDTGLFGRSWLCGWSSGFAMSGIFWNYVHFDFSFGGDYRDDHINRSGSIGMQAKSEGGGRW
jgi:hypothetical protein